MTIQRNNNVLVAIRRESAINVQATATGALQVRILDSPGLELKRAQIASAEKRTDLLKSMPRLGYKTVDGSYNLEATIGGAMDSLWEALWRSTWATSTAIGFSTMTIAITTNALTASSGSFITNGVRVGDIFNISGTTVAGNHNQNNRALAVTTLTIITATGAWTTLAATVTGTLTLLKKIVTPTVPVRYSYSVEQNDTDTDQSEIFTGVRVVGGKLSCKPGQPVTVQFLFAGIDRTTVSGASAPYFTSPTVTTGLALICEDSTLRYNGALATSFTGFDLDFTINAKGEYVIGQTASPDLFDDDMTPSGSITGLVQDFANLTLFDAETEFDLSIKLEEPNTGPPKSCFSIYLSRVKIGARTAPVGGGDGAKSETLPILIAPKVAATGYDAGLGSIQSSAP